MKTLELSLRQRKLLHFLQNRNEMVTGAVLARELNVTSRTIRSDVIVINQNLLPHHAEIRSIKSKGYYFTAENPELIQKLNQIDTAFFTKEDRLRYLAFQLCLSDLPISIYDLEDEMFVSHTTLEKDLHDLKLKYVVSEPYIRFTYTKGLLEFEKNEKKRRAILNHLFHEDWNYNTKGNAYYDYHFIDPDVIDYILDEAPRYLLRHSIHMEDSNLVSLNLAIAIMYHRIRTGHKLPESAPIPKPDTAAMYVANELLDHLEQYFHCPVPQAERDEIYLNIASGHLMDASALNFQTVNQFFGPVTLDMTNEYIHLIKEKFHVDFSVDEDFYITILQFIRYIQTPVHLFNMQTSTDISKENLLVELELAWLFQEIAIKYLGYYLNETELIHLAHCLSGALEYLYHNHPEYKIKTVICCHLHLSVTWAIKRKVLGSFDNYINITALLPINAKSAFDFTKTDLVLTTVQKQITDHDGTDVIHISPFINPSDFKNIQAYIEQKRIEKFYPAAKANLVHLLQDAFWHKDTEYTDVFSLIEFMASDFLRNDYASMDFLQDILRRESISTFAFQPGVLFLYSCTGTKHTQFSVSLLKNSITWSSHRIKTIIMASLLPEDLSLLFQLKYRFKNSSLSSDNGTAFKNKEELIQFLTK